MKKHDQRSAIQTLSINPSSQKIPQIEEEAILDEGYSNYFGEGRWKLTKGSLIIAKCPKLNSLYLMHAMVSSREVNIELTRMFVLSYGTKDLGT